MAGRIILVTGGARSGKSDFAESLAASLDGQKAYIATAEVTDEEMARRVSAHKKRRPADWITAEVPRHLSDVLPQLFIKADVILIDCLTVYVATLLYDYRECLPRVIEDRAGEEMREILRLLRQSGKSVILVTNEVGSGIVPPDAVSRLFRDVAGRVNRLAAAEADEVYLSVSGLAVEIKSRAVTKGE